MASSQRTVENLGLDVSSALENLCKRNGKCAAGLQGFLAKQIWTPGDRSSLMDRLAGHVAQPDCVVDVLRAFRSLTLDLLKRAQCNVNQQGVVDWGEHQNFSVALSKVVPISQEAVRFGANYLVEHEPFYRAESSQIQEPVRKKAKKKKIKAQRKRELVHAVWRFVQVLCTPLRDSWDWADFLNFLSDDDKATRWFAVQSVIKLVGLTPSERSAFIVHYFTPDEYKTLVTRYSVSHQRQLEQVQLIVNPERSLEVSREVRTHTMHEVVEADLSPSVVSVCGVLLPKLDTIKKADFDTLVAVPSMQRNLRSLALAVAVGAAVLLQGPVGCGKTALVEHLATLTGRSRAPHLLKVQLGDQTDSKALLGTYRCTNIPGEFVWQAGSLTRAVTEGHWVLLEDIDYAPMDVISVLLPLLQSGMLSLPGHGDSINPAPGFRLFATQRLLGSGGALYKMHSAGADILGRMWTMVAVEPMSRDELKQVITTRHPQLATVTDRLLDVYFLLSAGRHGNTSNGEVDDDVGKFLSHDGRLISTRDLMKWCGRIAVDFDVSKTHTANLVFQECLDCFCACLAKTSNRLPLAEAIGARLNLTKSKAEFFCTTHKPSVEVSAVNFTVGRVSLQKKEQVSAQMQRFQSSSFAYTRAAVSLLERVAVAVANNEPVLLVGETGTGKTSSVQYLAEQIGHKLRVINMNQQSDSTDLLGGFKPVDLRLVVAPVREKFETLFCSTFSRKQNIKFLSHIQECFARRRWTNLLKLMEHSQQTAIKKFEQGTEQYGQWEDVGESLSQLRAQVRQAQTALAFTFIEGSLVQALRRGDWVLLDEINLATAETLECLSGLLESTSSSIVLMERGDTEPVVRHPNFRLFACMNPATDVGKKDLPPGVRNRFTELFVDELEDTSDLRILVAEYLKGLSLTVAQLDGIVNFYLTIRSEVSKKLTDGTGHRPHYSLRTLCRALRHAAKNTCNNVPRSLFEGFCLSFLTELDRTSHPIVEELICKLVVGRSKVKSLLKQSIPEPYGHKHLNFEGFWVATGKLEPSVPEGYVLTPSVRANLRDIARVVSAGCHPVLLQGETSVGKTSLITWLAAASGNVCMRINNHEHTDLQEYVGCYAADETGKLMFKEGVLVEAMKKGHWIILDELNLAPTDVLEALNRLLDDNRELFLPETQEVVKAHPHFMLFATQNPPGLYGGRKVLSRAFRNRFIELHFDDIPSSELETILHERCHLPPSYAKRLVAVMLELQTRRRGSSVFAGKQGFITLRDLFRWAERYRQASYETSEKFFDWDQQLADNGYMLLAGRCRKPDESAVIQKVIEKHLRRSVDPVRLYTLDKHTSPTTAPLLQPVLGTPPGGFEHVVWTYNMRRMAVLVGQALKFGEPVLLVGDTGCGKTTVCQLYAAINKQPLHSVNCHLHTESADFLGGLRPVRHTHEETEENSSRLFEWNDGPLVVAMRTGSMFLIDEISLADDSVLERLNSVLELERTLVLAEKGGGDGQQNEVDVIKAEKGFRVVATMNPGGDYGKKELSPALRNRFTEIWCPQSGGRDDLVAIIEHNIKPGIHLANQEDGTSGVGNAIINFVIWFSNNDLGRRSTVSIRDILSWVNFINTTARTLDADSDMQVDSASSSHLDPAVAYVHGACMVFLDALGSGVTAGGSANPAAVRQLCLDYLIKQVKDITGQKFGVDDLGLLTCEGSSPGGAVVVGTSDMFGVPPFFISKGDQDSSHGDQYALDAPTTSMNTQRVLRALQLPRPILLEGSPGVGKTSLVGAIAKAAGHSLVRINLSEQTDVADLFGADLPVEGGAGGQFAWRDGPLLRALKAGHWVVLDELNLASQSVLEGLNACLDHRAEVYVPELGRSFQVQQGRTRLFACQNPLHQGGGRKGLPRSFLNRFTQVYVEPLSREDLLFITTSMYPHLPGPLRENMVDFNHRVCVETMEERGWGLRGSPWEFNLRDIFRWCDLLTANQAPGGWDAGEYVGLIYSARMRTAPDKARVMALHQEMFPSNRPPYTPQGDLHVTSKVLQVGHSFLPRRRMLAELMSVSAPDLSMLHHSLRPLEDLMKCISMNWMAILVGPACSGKTSLVRLLAQLTGHPLHVLPMNSDMDTTELLGGFEQADLNRHLEEVTRSIRTVLHQITASLLVVNKEGTCTEEQRLLSCWNKYTALCQKLENVPTRAESEILTRKLANVKDVVMAMGEVNRKYNMEHTGDLSGLLVSLDQIQSQLTTTGSVNQGGQFEWVDSVLVRALGEGHWLLIDNVNFCSPSVLDRLNALLEPRGVLTINERGVIDGQVPTITPHPEFRLILAMDPRYGEISRAMRNRGIEIYILGEEEGGQFDDHDVDTLLDGAGITGFKLCETLKLIHSSVKEHLSFANHCHVVELLRVAALTHQQLQHGADLVTAILNSSLDVYVRGQSDPTLKKTLQDIISGHLASLDLGQYEVNTGTSSLLKVGHWSQSLPHSGDWADDVTLATVRHDTALLLHLVDCLVLGKNNGSSIPLSVSDLTGSEVTWRRTEDTFAMLDPVLHVLVEHATLRNWEVLNGWVSQQVALRVSAVSDAGREVALVRQAVTVLQTRLEAIFKHDVSQNVAGHLRSLALTEDDMMTLEEQPIDLRWNPHMVRHLVFAHAKHGSTDANENLSSIGALVNQLLFVSHFRSRWLIFTDGLDVTPGKKKLTMQEISPLQLSYAFHKGAVELPSLPHPVVAHLKPFIQLLFESLDKQWCQQNALSDTQLYQLLQNFCWLEHFVDICRQPIRSSRTDVLLPNLALHWDWLHRKLLPGLLKQESVKPELRSVISELQSQLGIDSVAASHQVSLWNHLGHPQPFQEEDSAAVTVRLAQLARLLNHEDGRGVRSMEVERVRCLQTDGATVGRLTLSCLTQLTSREVDENRDGVKECIDQLQEVLRKHGLMLEEDAARNTSTDIEMTPAIASSGIKAHQVALWPLFDLLTLRSMHSLIGQLPSGVGGEDHGKADLRRLVEFASTHLNGTPVHLFAPHLLSIAENEESKVKEILPVLVTNFIGWLQTSTATRGVHKWLYWKSRTTDDDMECTVASRQMGPYDSLLTHVATEMLVSSSTTPDNWLPSDIAVGEMAEKVSQLAVLTRTLWTHASVMSSGMWTPSECDRQFLTGSMQQLLTAITSHVDRNLTQIQNHELVETFIGSTGDLEMTLSGLDLGQLNVLMPNFEAVFKASLVAARTCMHQHKTATANQQAFDCGKALLHMGLLQTFLLAPQGPVDPAQKKAVKLEYAREELNNITTELNVRNTWSQLTSGSDLDLSSPDLHPRIHWLVERQCHLETVITELSSNVAIRPHPPRFPELLRETKQFTSSVAAVEHVSNIVASLSSTAKSLTSSEAGAAAPSVGKVLSEVKTWISTLQMFVGRIQTNYPLYQDVTLPFVAGVSQMLYGAQLMATTIDTWRTKVTLLPKQLKLSQPTLFDDVVVMLGRFPTIVPEQPTLLSLATRLQGETTLALLTSLQEAPCPEGTGDHTKLTPRVLKSALLQLRNHAWVSGSLDTTTLYTLSRLFSQYVSSWQQAEAERKLREAEKESLYKYKTTTCGEELSEEEVEERELRVMFPSFEKDFEDITVGFTLDDKPKLPEDDIADSDDDVTWQLSEQEKEEVCQIHKSVFPALTRTPWRLPTGGAPKCLRECHITEPTLTCYQVAAQVVQKLPTIVGWTCDAPLVGAHLLASHALQVSVKQETLIEKQASSESRDSSERPYDIYRDANIPEVLQCRPIIHTFRCSVDKLLEEWPDHPTLTQMVVVMERILSFPVTSPLIKFVTGLEVLLDKGHEWEMNAARHVSLREHTEAVTHLIIQWRKVELKCWRMCLESAVWKARQGAVRWWFHLYQLIEGVMNPTEPEKKQDDGSEPPTPEGATSLLPALQQFLEGATLGEYSARLELLQAFLCQLTYMDKTDIQEELVRLLWNVHSYYAQFESHVAAEISRLRTPLEKELKGFVKIAKWNDINFYALKQAVDKTHRTLHKQVKAFQSVLARPVISVLTDTKSDWTTQNEAADGLNITGEESETRDIETFLAEKNLEVFLSRVGPADEASDSQVLSRLPALFKKMRHHCGHVLRQLPHHRRSATLDDFTGSVISTVHDLQKAEVVIQGPEKETLRRNAKFLVSRKHKALSDLFKYLTVAGLSYRKGLVTGRSADMNRHLMLPPVDLTALLTQLQSHRCDESTMSAWRGCERYMWRCVARHALLKEALQRPSPELGVGNVHRCQGFSENLLSVVIEQREGIAKTADTFWNLRQQLSALHRLAADSEIEGLETSLPPQTAAQEWRMTLKTLCDQLVVGLQQVHLLLDCCPEAPPEGEGCVSPLLPSNLPPSAMLHQQDDTWQEVTGKIKTLLEGVQDVKTSVDEQVAQSAILSTWKQVADLKDYIQRLHSMVDTLRSVELVFRAPQTGEGSAVTVTLTYLIDQIISSTQSFNRWADGTAAPREESQPSADDLRKVSEDVDDFVRGLLLVVQTFVKDAQSSPEVEDPVEILDEGEGDHQEVLEKGHVTTLLHEGLKSDLGALELNKVSSRLGCLLQSLCEHSESNTHALNTVFCQRMVASLPLLTQYCHLVQSILTEAAAAHRATSKLLSVLLAVFTELAAKGFCLPAELSEEMEGEGATKFEDIEGGGMGEGEGAKDVSDQIETEDQLDEARKAGEEQPEDDMSKQPDIAPEDNAIEMDTQFEGKMHDLENKEGGEESDSEDEAKTEEMGDLDEQQTDKLDEQIWGSDDEDDKDEAKDDKEEFGPGAGDQTESELVAKDDNQDATKSEEEKKEQQQNQEEDGEDKVKEQTDIDEREYDENEVDPHYGNEQPHEEPEAMDLPDDLNLDDEEKEEGGDKDGAETEENPYDIDKLVEESGPQEGVTEEEEEKDGEQDGKEQDMPNEDKEAEKEDKDNDDKGEGDEPAPEEEAEAMDTGETQEGPPEGEPGLEPQLEPESDDSGQRLEEEETKAEEAPQSEVTGKKQHDTEQVDQTADAQDAAASNDNEQNEADGTGVAESKEEEGHEGDRSTSVTRSGHDARQRQQSKRKPGKSDADRTIGSAEEKVDRHLKTVDRPDQERLEDDQPRGPEESDLYEHIKDAKSSHDAQTMDAADAEQEQATPAVDDQEEADDLADDDADMKPDDRDQSEETSDIEKLSAAKLKPSKPREEQTEGENVVEGEVTTAKTEVDGEKVETVTAGRGATSTFHTDMDNFMDFARAEVDVEQLRRHLEEELHTWTQTSQGPSSVDRSKEGAAKEAWQQYEAITSGLSQELCEQLRLVLEPTQASKLRGDYRTGKRLNMRKVIPYVASQFRKDKIWLRRTKPSKRQYQVMIAVDDSSSMADNHSKQLAFESVAVVANALTLLEVGELAISSFGESVKLLHPFHDQFTNQSGARILQQFTFEQKKTKIAQLLKQMSAVMVDARSHQRVSSLHADTSQLLLIVSDGRGLFLEGMEVVKMAVRQAWEANIFLVFVIIDNPDNKDSILDIRVPVFKGAGQLPEIKSYMDHFPFPFYIILRDINSLPSTLSDALRQWFELVTAGDK